MNAFPATHVEGGVLTKPADWAICMVIAAMKCASDVQNPLTYPTPDEARFGILKTLNWLEAHGEYEWPEFSHLNLDFNQVMRLRRALVQDVFNALHKAGTVKTAGAPGTFDSIAGTRRGRDGGSEDRRTIDRKRICKREAEVEDDTMSVRSEGRRADDDLIIEAMIHLAARSKVDMDVYIQEDRSSRELADMLHDSLVEVWERPQQDLNDQNETLRQKAKLWSSIPPRPSQRERTATPRTSPIAPQPSSATAQKPRIGSVSTRDGNCWDLNKSRLSGFTAANDG